MTMMMKLKPQFPEQEQLKCPRCDSTNTKFCYYNNYNLSQPRHFCKNCRRYWTKGGALRNIPVGGGTRKTTKRSKRSAPTPLALAAPNIGGAATATATASFTSLLASAAQFESLLDLEALNSSASVMQMGSSDPLVNSDSGLGMQSNGNWSDLAISTPGSSFQ